MNEELRTQILDSLRQPAGISLHRSPDEVLMPAVNILLDYIDTLEQRIRKLERKADYFDPWPFT